MTAGTAVHGEGATLNRVRAETVTWGRYCGVGGSGVLALCLGWDFFSCEGR